ncbi:hypothetical protein SAMN02983003_3135 [Devosia enhydra]|uniref:Uncharacterized protein n=1 Tax=Devosia enhydra TaxID=665118 RepID=A0A1K2I170_9HYPH|nr:hypothetical protein [Devosia enhydra]SFZ85963.1 hypothetical protein SAMN02983003_3135 [Devosia enhydra]
MSARSATWRRADSRATRFDPISLIAYAAGGLVILGTCALTLGVMS